MGGLMLNGAMRRELDEKLQRADSTEKEFRASIEDERTAVTRYWRVAGPRTVLSLASTLTMIGAVVSRLDPVCLGAAALFAIASIIVDIVEYVRNRTRHRAWQRTHAAYVATGEAQSACLNALVAASGGKS